MSSAKPRLLFAIHEEDDEGEEGEWRFFSLPQLQNPYEESSSTLVAAAEFHVKFPPGDLRIHPANLLYCFQCAYASGLIYFNGRHYDERPLVCNPNTGRYAILPYPDRNRNFMCSFFGFDPIDKQYKVLFMNYPYDSSHQKILTLGRDMRWREIKCSLRHNIKSEEVCINGVLYYLGDTSGLDYYNAAYDVTSDYVIVCFDFRSEKFTFIGIERFCQLINYKGKLAIIFWDDDVDIYLEYDVNSYWEDNVDTIIELHVWVQEDVEKQEWSKYAYTLNDDKFFSRRYFSVVGVTACGEIVFARSEYTCEKPFYVFYFNPEKNTLRRVEIQGLGETFKNERYVLTFVNHVEDLNVHDLNLLKSVHAPIAELEDSEYDSE